MNYINKILRFLSIKVVKISLYLEIKFLIKFIFFISNTSFDFAEKKLTSGNKSLYIARLSRLYYYTLGINSRINLLLDEYLIFSNNLKIKKHDYLIDVGANIGEFTIGFNTVFNNENFIAIEPDPTEYSVLKKNLSNFKNCFTYNIALSNKTGNVNFYLANESGDSSLDNITKKSINVECKTLDSVTKKIENIGLIKLEAEGHEPEILKGSINTLKKTKYITVDVGPERNNCSTYESVNEILVRNNFKLLNRGKTRDTVIYYNANLINHNN